MQFTLSFACVNTHFFSFRFVLTVKMFYSILYTDFNHSLGFSHLFFFFQKLLLLLKYTGVVCSNGNKFVEIGQVNKSFILPNARKTICSGVEKNCRLIGTNIYEIGMWIYFILMERSVHNNQLRHEPFVVGQTQDLFSHVEHYVQHSS